MEIQSNSLNKKQDPIIIDDFEIEDIPFKPITDGLGFHEKHQDVKRVMPNKAKVHQKIYEEVVLPKVDTPTRQSTTANQNIPRELEAFYKGTGNVTSQRVNKKIDLTLKVERNAPMSLRLVSWLIDFSFCFSLISLITVGMFFGTAMSLEHFQEVLMKDLNFMFPVSLFVLIYLVYNISLGFQATFGQKIVGIETKFDIDDNRTATFFLKRSLLELVSLLTLGLIHIAKLDKSILNNKVVKK